ncbi:MAG: hypothetical protein E7436_03800 [Ruminococcaceae bacterium]|nr:hypothetical protein [Oscillospiraceae bacterium]
MYAMLHELLRDHTEGIVFQAFGLWHILYLLLIFSAIFFCIRFLKPGALRKAVDAAIGIAFGLYMLDFFLMPLAYGNIDTEKLPIHACTAMCLLSFLSRRVPVLYKWKDSFTLLGLISNLVYVLVPMGIQWAGVHPFSYRAVQTLLFHGAMTAYGILALCSGDVKLQWKNWKRELLTVIGMTLWALLGNAVYNGLDGRLFNWFFVVRDPFYMLPESISPYIMPPLVIVSFFAAEMVCCLVFNCRRIKNGIEKNEIVSV